MTIPCVGPITSSVLAAELGNGQQFMRSRLFSLDWVGAQQHSTGDKTVLLGISKRGDRNQRRLLIQCARVYLMGLERQTGALADWVRQLLARHHSNRVVCALANKLARIAWSIAVTTMNSRRVKRDERLTSLPPEHHPPGFAMLDNR
ncbi:transposase [Pseudomonas sp. BIC9C]|uniref:transposase n=1 Tax=Pseudomonas sp. BIC9C TaxID=3078458 RepID=UPI003A521D2E